MMTLDPPRPRMHRPDEEHALDEAIFGGSNRADPYPAYHALREHDPVYWSDRYRTWLLTGYDDVLAVLRNPRASSDHRVARDGLDALASVLLFMDPPDHTRLRRLVSKAFSPRIVMTLQNHVRETAGLLLTEVWERGSFELMDDFAFPLPITIVCELLGIPLADRNVFREQSPKLSTILEIRSTLPEESRSAGEEAAMTLAAYFSTLIEQRRSAPGDDLISALLVAEDAGDTLTHTEMLMTCVLLVIAGHETTMGLIGNGTVALLRHPDQAERFRTDQRLTKSAIEELVRIDSPIQYTMRTAIDDIEVGDRVIGRGEQAMLLLGAANHDHARFTDPDELRLDREDNAHLGFGFGTHFCLGAALARLEGQIALRALFDHFPELALASPPTWRPGVAIRSPLSVPLAFGRQGQTA